MKNDGESFAAFLQTTALLVARAPGLYFSDSFLSMKLLRGALNQPLQRLFILNSPLLVQV